MAMAEAMRGKMLLYSQETNADLSIHVQFVRRAAGSRAELFRRSVDGLP